MPPKMGEDSTAPRSGQRVTVDEAARVLGLSVDAVRKRVQRDQIAHEKDAAGRVRIILDESETLQDKTRDTTGPERDAPLLEALDEMREQVRFLREQLQAERRANEENRRLLAAALERIPPQLEAPPEEPEAPETATEQPGRVGPQAPIEGPQEAAERPWWRRWF